MATDCPVCCEPYTGVHRRRVECPYPECKYGVCAGCIIAYLSASTTPETACMNCNRSFSLEYLAENVLSRAAVNRVRENQRSIAISLDRAHRAEALPYVPAYKSRLDDKKRLTELIKEIDEADSHLASLKDRKRRIVANIADAERPRARARLEEHRPRVVWEYPCTVHECRGLVAPDGKCHVCETWSCKRCSAPKTGKEDPDHECTQENIDTTRELRRNTKPCPGCGTLISRSAGCPQMHCVACRTNFDYRTGHILEERTVMNPHLAQWRAQNPNAEAAPVPEHNPCNGSARGLADTMFGRGWPACTRARRMFSHVARSASAAERYATQCAAWLENGAADLKIDHGIKFFAGEKDEGAWTRVMNRIWEKRQRAESYMQIWQTFATVVADTLRLALRDINRDDFEALTRTYASLNRIRIFTNDQLRKSASLHKGGVPCVLAFPGQHHLVFQGTPYETEWLEWEIEFFGQPVAASL